MPGLPRGLGPAGSGTRGHYYISHKPVRGFHVTSCVANGERELRHMTMCGRLHVDTVLRLGGTFGSAGFPHVLNTSCVDGVSNVL